MVPIMLLSAITWSNLFEALTMQKYYHLQELELVTIEMDRRRDHHQIEVEFELAMLLIDS